MQAQHDQLQFQQQHFLYQQLGMVQQKQLEEQQQLMANQQLAQQFGGTSLPHRCCTVHLHLTNMTISSLSRQPDLVPMLTSMQLL